MKRRLVIFSLLLLATAAGWFAWERMKPAPPSVSIDLAQHDGATIDFSSGKPVIKDTPADRAALAREAKEMEDAAQGVTFGAPKQKTEPSPAPPKK